MNLSNWAELHINHDFNRGKIGAERWKITSYYPITKVMGFILKKMLNK